MDIQITLSESHDLILYSSRLKMLPGLAISLAFVAAGLWIASSSGDAWNASIGIVSIIFFGLGVLMCLIGLVRPFPVLVVNEEGLRQPGLFWSIFVAWEETAAIISSKGSSISLNIYLSESGKVTFSARYPRTWRISRLSGEGMPALSFSRLLLPVPAQSVSEMLQEKYQRQIEEYNILVR